jgi:O-succinylbenzoic acid--CoA ligase
MPKSLPRELVQVQQEWPIAQVTQGLRMALDGQGPALAFGPITHSHVAKNIAVVIPTSGSTGIPKEVALTSKALFASAKAAHKYLKAKKNERWSLLLPINHIAGVNVLVRSIALQSEIIDLRGKNTNESAEYTSIVPTQLYRALNGDNDLLEHLRSAKAVLVGGSPTADDLLEEAKSKNINVITTYGMSEMSGGCIYNNKPLSGVKVKIKKHQVIALSGPMQAKTYLNDQNAWKATTSKKWFITSDFGEYKKGKLIINGRIDDLIISGGEKISLATIEVTLNEIFPSQRFMTCASKDAEWGERLILASDGQIEIEKIKVVLKDKFGDHAVPKAFMPSIELPITSIGKPDRKKLLTQFERLHP